MVDVASIVVAVISLVGAIGAGALAAWATLYSDHRRRLTETEKLVAKYREPLLLAANDLSSRIYNIVEQDVLSWFDSPDKRRRDLLNIYTCFVVGQYFAWTSILRRQAQFLCFSTDKQNKHLADSLAAITKFFATDSTYSPGQPFSLWRGQQMALGEIMTITADTELVCLGYAAFTKKLQEEEFREWFDPVLTGIVTLFEQRGQRNGADDRLRHMQHLLMDLMSILDTKQLRSGSQDTRRCRRSPRCTCKICQSNSDVQQPSGTATTGAKRDSRSRV